MLSRCLAAGFLAAASALPLASAQDRPPTPSQILAARVTAWHSEHDAPGITAAAILPDGILVETAVGHADPRAGTPLTSRDRMLSGSIGKTYVAAVAIHLILAGKLSLDDKLTDILDRQEDAWVRRVPNAASITTNHLLHHTAGVPDHVWGEAFGEQVVSQPDKVWSAEDRCQTILDAAPLFAAGSGWAYADTNYVLLGAILERVSGRTIEDLQRSLLFEPLGLRDTICADRRELEGVVLGHCSGLVFLEGPNLDDDGRMRINPQVEWCGGGIASTAGDLARWGRALFSGRAFSETRRDEALAILLDTVETRSRRLPGKYGAGVHVRDSAHGPVQGHSGIMAGYLSLLAHYPDLGVTVALQWNTDDPRTTGPMPRLADTLAGALAEAARPGAGEGAGTQQAGTTRKGS